MKRTGDNLTKKILDWLIAIFLVSNSLCWGLIFLPNPMVILMVLVLVTFLLIEPSALSHIRIWIICILVFILFIVGELLHDTSLWLTTYFIEFLMVGVTGLFLGSANFNITRIFRYICYLSLPTALVISKMNFHEMDYGQWMGTSYGCIKYIITLIIALFGGLKILKKGWQKIAAIFMLLLFLHFFLHYGSRGAILGIIIALFFIYAIKKTYNLKKIFTIIILTTASIFIVWNTLFPIIVGYVMNNNVNSFAISKMATSNDLSNGRSDLVDEGIELFEESPVLGHGVSSFESKYNRYVHNVFLQIMCDGGIIYLSLFLIVLWMSFRIAFGTSTPLNVKLFIVFLISGYLVELLFSNYLWRSHGLWLLIGYTVSKHKSIVKWNQVYSANSL